MSRLGFDQDDGRVSRNASPETVRRFDGFVTRYLGDGVLMYFGYPHAHEDDAGRGRAGETGAGRGESG